MTRNTRSYSAVAASNSTQPDPISMASTSTTTTPPVIDVNHPFYLHNGDNPGMAIVTQLLTEQIIRNGVVLLRLRYLLN